jgi:hypothetical protein
VSIIGNRKYAEPPVHDDQIHHQHLHCTGEPIPTISAAQLIRLALITVNEWLWCVEGST